ncbi:type II secretion system F family protein [Vampirovibrio chlorellavorus]|uniref:type II secretion system F family protein n=1 Tax=Vampirovibrio chlorellavorus TaxID=758823 RepID=UPI0026F31C4F|nr:type II secretion system F family protein [Vampirovibrio chlorellavorus]
MSPMLLLILMLMAFLLMAVGFGAAVFLFQRYANPEPTEVQKRLMMLKQRTVSESQGPAEDQLKKLASLFKEADYQNEKLGAKLERIPFFLTLKIRMQQAGINTPADKYFIMNMLMPVVILTVLALVSGFFMMILLGLIWSVGSYLLVLFKRKQRYAKFIAQFPDALSMITSALRAGHSFQSALTVVASEMPNPIALEFASMVKDINLGIPVRESLSRLVAKLDTLPDVRMFATAVMIQREAGGNLAEVLESLGYTIRERFKLKGQISALTGQSRLTGYVLGGAPAFLLILLSVFFYGYVSPLYETEMGHVALMIAVVLQCIGFSIMKKIVDIRV